MRLIQPNMPASIPPENTGGGFPGWITEQLAERAINVINYGAKIDGITDDSVALQAAIDAAAAVGGGHVFIPNLGTMLLNQPIIVKHKVMVFSSGGVQGQGGCKIKSGHSGIMFTDEGQGKRSAFMGLVIEGKTDGGTTTVNGINISGMTRITNVYFNFFKESAVRLNSTSIASTLQDIICINCVTDRTVSEKTGGIHILGTDHFLSQIEANVQSGRTDVTPLKNAVSLYIGGANHFITDCIGEFGEIGIYVDSSKSRFKGCRADRCMGDGFVVANSQNLFSSCHAMECGTAANNTYDGFVVSGINNRFMGCTYTTQGTSVIRYGIYDQASNFSQKNEYFGCDCFTNAGTAKFKNEDFHGSGFEFGNGWYRITTGSSWDVSGKKRINYSGDPVTVTNFTGGVNGQSIEIYTTNNATIANNANISTSTGANKVLNNRIHRFTMYNGRWYEDAIYIAPVTSVSSAPSFIGQLAVVGGIGYLATATGSAADWKQITN